MHTGDTKQYNYEYIRKDERVIGTGYQWNNNDLLHIRRDKILPVVEVGKRNKKRRKKNRETLRAEKKAYGQEHFGRRFVNLGKKAHVNLEAGRECVWRGMGENPNSRQDATQWWEWSRGSRCFFWRWKKEFQEKIRDGQPPWWIGPHPKYRKNHQPPKDKGQRKCEEKKVNKARKRLYIEPGDTQSLMPYFSVPKVVVEQVVLDIRMVYNGSKSGLNDSLLTPHFSLPSGRTALRTIEEGTYLADNDIGEMFLNFILHESDLFVE